MSSSVLCLVVPVFVYLEINIFGRKSAVEHAAIDDVCCHADRQDSGLSTLASCSCDLSCTLLCVQATNLELGIAAGLLLSALFFSFQYARCFFMCSS